MTNKEIDKISGIEVIKFMSPHPKDFSDELIEYIAENKKISRQIFCIFTSNAANSLSENSNSLRLSVLK